MDIPLKNRFNQITRNQGTRSELSGVGDAALFLNSVKVFQKVNAEFPQNLLSIFTVFRRWILDLSCSIIIRLNFSMTNTLGHDKQSCELMARVCLHFAVNIHGHRRMVPNVVVGELLSFPLTPLSAPIF